MHQIPNKFSHLAKPLTQHDVPIVSSFFFKRDFFQAGESLLYPYYVENE